MIKRNPLYISLCLITFLFLLIVIIFTNKLELHQTINSYHSKSFDYLFDFTTYLGGSIFFIFTFLYFILKKHYNNAVILSIGYTITVFFVLFGKHVVFQDINRPVTAFLNNELDLRIIDGLEMKRFKSFPSGHSADIFYVTAFLAYYIGKKNIDFILFIIAALTAFSRIYLSQHFTEDVLAGGFLAIFCVLIVVKITEKQITTLNPRN